MTPAEASAVSDALDKFGASEHAVRVVTSPGGRPGFEITLAVLHSNLRQEALLTEIRDLLAAGSGSSPSSGRTPRKRAPKAG